MPIRPSRAQAALVISVAVLLLAGCTAAAPEAEAPTTPRSAEPSEPAEGGCPAPPADAPAGTAEDPYGLGEEIVLGCFTVTVDEVVPDATDVVVEANPATSREDGNVFATVTITVARTAGGAADATEVVPVVHGSTTTSGEPSLDLVAELPPPTQRLQEGDSVTGTYVYEVSGGASLSVEFDRDGETISVLPY